MKFSYKIFILIKHIQENIYFFIFLSFTSLSITFTFYHFFLFNQTDPKGKEKKRKAKFESSCRDLPKSGRRLNLNQVLNLLTTARAMRGSQSRLITISFKKLEFCSGLNQGLGNLDSGFLGSSTTLAHATRGRVFPI